MQLIIILVFLFISITNGEEVDQKQLKCLVCRSTVEEMETVIKNTDPKKKIELGKRLGPDGSMVIKSLPLIKSETWLSEQLETVCSKFDNYIRARYKSNGRLTIFNLLSPAGGMNPDMSNVDIIQDGDLNRSLEHICRQIVEEYDEEFVKVFQEDKSDKINELCSNKIPICTDTLPDDDDQDEDEDLRTEL